MPKTKKTFIPIHQNGLIADMGIDMSVQCLGCNNLLLDAPITCKAFPKGIIKDILSGNFNHIKKHPDQDNDILFEPIKE